MLAPSRTPRSAVALSGPSPASQGSLISLNAKWPELTLSLIAALRDRIAHSVRLGILLALPRCGFLAFCSFKGIIGLGLRIMV